MSGLPSVPLPCPYTSISESLSLCSLIPPLPLPPFSWILSCPTSGWSSGSALSQSKASFFIGADPFQVALLTLLTWAFKFIVPFIVSYCIHNSYCPGDWAGASRERHTMWILSTLLPSTPLVVVGSCAPLCSGPFTSVSDLFCGIHFQFCAMSSSAAPCPLLWRGMPGPCHR